MHEMTLKKWLALGLAMIIAAPAWASLDVARQGVPDAELAGEARFRVLFWNVYDAALYAPEGDYRADAPFALSLTYLRDFTSDQIVGRTMAEIERQPDVDAASLAPWREQLSALIPDVQKGMTITGLRDSTGRAQFYLGVELLGTIQDTELSRRFFDIWLGEHTSAPEFQQALLRTGG
jgi:hypothetical protein